MEADEEVEEEAEEEAKREKTHTLMMKARLSVLHFNSTSVKGLVHTKTMDPLKHSTGTIASRLEV